MDFHWEEMSGEHIALLKKNDPLDDTSASHVLAARRADGSLAGWVTIIPGPMVSLASESPIVSIRLMERIDNISRSLGLAAYGISTRREILAKQLERLPGVRYVEEARGMRWYMRTVQ